MNNIVKLTTFNLRNKRKYILGWCLGIGVMMFVYMILFPSMQDLGQAKLDSLPDSMLEVMGVDSFAVMSNWVSYFGMIFNIFMLVISFFAATFAGSILFSEEKTKSIEFMNALPVSRSEIYISKLLTSFIAVLFLTISADFVAIVCGFINGGNTFVIMDVLQIMKITGFIPFFFMALALLAGGVTAKISPSMIGSALVIVFYMFSYLGGLLEDKGQWLQDITPFKQLDPTKAIALNSGTMVAITLFFLISILAIIVGNLVYRKRDFNI